KGFSKGMRQRTKLATAIAHNPDFVLLDEPLTGVDPKARIEIIEQIKKLGEAGKTIVIRIAFASIATSHARLPRHWRMKNTSRGSRSNAVRCSSRRATPTVATSR